MNEALTNDPPGEPMEFVHDIASISCGAFSFGPFGVHLVLYAVLRDGTVAGVPVTPSRLREFGTRLLSLATEAERIGLGPAGIGVTIQ